MPLISKVLFLLVSFMVEPAVLNPDVGYPCDGNLRGLYDSGRKVILHPQFSRIDNVGRGFYMGWSVNPKNRFEYGTERHLFNSTGDEFPVKVPEGAQFVQVFWLGQTLEDYPDVQSTTLPPGAIFRFSKNQKFGLCDKDGKVILPADYESIGKANEGKAFVMGRDSGEQDKSLYVFKCRENALEKLPLGKASLAPLSALSQLPYFSDGLAAISGENQKNGYIDEKGKFVIEPKFKKTGPFIKGMATVQIDGPTGELLTVAIDKTGKVVSPSGMEVQDFHGDYAVARDTHTKSALFGVVDRKFKYVIEPKYESISPNVLPELATLNSPAAEYSKSPLFYSANETKGGRLQIVLGSGATVCSFPETYHINHLGRDGSVLCWVAPKSAQGKGEMTYVNFHGMRVPNPHGVGVADKRETYFPISDDRLVITIDLDDSKFIPEYWQNQCHTPISPRTMFGRFLKDYDLIGMSTEEVRRLLGESRFFAPTQNPEDYFYSIEWGCMSDLDRRVVIHLKDGKVESWCFAKGESKSAPITTNVLLQLPDALEGSTEAQLTEVKPK